MQKVFSAHSLMNGFEGHDSVTMRWFVLERQNPVAPYEEATGERISGLFSVETLDECLTESELSDLTAYLKASRHLDVEADEVSLPIHEGVIPLSAMGTGRLLTLDEHGQERTVPAHGYYDLWSQEGYSLPFKVRGYYDLNDGHAHLHHGVHLAKEHAAKEQAVA